MFAPKVAKPQAKVATISSSKLTPSRSTLIAQSFGRGTEQAVDPASLTAQGAIPSVSRNFSRVPAFAPDRVSRPEAPAPLTAPPLPNVVDLSLTPQSLVLSKAREAGMFAPPIARPKAW